jgi:GNAT superfamily N-acetyltransferase
MIDLPAVIAFRHAKPEDLPAIVAMLADDVLSETREDPSLPLDPRYLAAFAAIAANPNQYLMVVEHDDAVIATLQITFLAGLSKKGAWRGGIEAVRVRADRRGLGLGSRMIAWAVETCRAKGCTVVQLSADSRRADAHRFYERLGFAPTHIGYRLEL